MNIVNFTADTFKQCSKMLQHFYDDEEKSVQFVVMFVDTVFCLLFRF